MCSQFLHLSREQPIARVQSQTIISARGLGAPKIPKKILAFLAKHPELTTSYQGSLPRVMVSEDAKRVFEASNNPMGLVAGKKMIVAGQGDTANTDVELLAGGLNVKDGYAISNAQVGLPEKNYWAGQDNTTCIAFINKARSRYAANGTVFRTSKAKGEALGEGISSKVVDLDFSPDKTRVVAIMENGRRIELDHLILATAYPSVEPVVDGINVVYINGKTSVSLEETHAL